MLFQFGILGGGGLDPTNIGAADILTLMLRVVNIALGLVGAIALVYILIAGIQYMTAGGDEKKQGESKQTIQAALIGLLIVAASFALTNTLLRQLAFNYTIIQDNPNVPSEVKQKFQ